MSIDSIVDEPFAQVENSLVTKIQNPGFFGRIGRTIKVLTYVAVITTALNLAEKVNAAIHYVNPGQSIQAAINNAVDKDEIIVLPARYFENINFLGKAITLRSTEPENKDVVESTIIDGNQNGSVVIFNSGEDANSVLSGLTLTNGKPEGVYLISSSPTIYKCTIIGNGLFRLGSGGGIYCTSNSNPHISDTIISRNLARTSGGVCISSSNPIFNNCIIEDNGANTGGVNTYSSQVSFTNCMIIGNKGSYAGAVTAFSSYLHFNNCTITGNENNYLGVIFANYHSNLTFVNSIIWGNTLPTISTNINSTIDISYNNVQGGYLGLGNIDVDPCFVSPGYRDPNGTPNDANDDFWVQGDYHLKSEGWRWDKERRRWDYDTVTSRCIDAGNPSSPLENELLTIPDDPNHQWGINKRSDMGAYGGTEEASMPPHGWVLLADMNNDGVVNTPDLVINVMYWLVSGEDNMPPDLNKNKKVDMKDFGLFAEDWMKKTSWYDN